MKTNPVILVHGGTGYKPLIGGGHNAASAARLALKALLRINGQAGLIALDRKGRFAIMHTTDYTACGYAKGKRIKVQARMRQVR
jgi:isoaspartyl peptidase/L-asparaginase-like protein (Ntn-hydrolase superfamily)